MRQHHVAVGVLELEPSVKVPAGGVWRGKSGQYTSVWSVLSAQPKPPPTLTSVNVPAGGETGLAAVPNGRPQHASVWSVRTAHACGGPGETLRAVNVPAGGVASPSPRPPRHAVPR